MAEFTICNLCNNPSSFQESREAAKVHSHVECFKDESFTVWRCNNCGSLHSKEDVDLGRYYAEYPFKRHWLDYHTTHGYRNRIQMLKKSGVKESDRILDFGCGAGLFVDFLKREGFSQAQGYDPFINKFSDPTVLNNQYDVVVSYDVIEHVEDPKVFFQQMVQFTKPHGLVVIGTPNATELSLKGKDPSNVVELSQPYHRHMLSEKALFDLASNFGLITKTVHHRFYFDTLMPLVNTKFMWNYIKATGGMIDVCVEKLQFKKIFTSPKLMFYGLFGYFFRVPGNILVTFENAHKGIHEKTEDDYSTFAKEA